MTTPERAFLHELMNLLTIADGNCRKIKRTMIEGETEDIEAYLEKVQTSITKIIILARERREILINEQDLKDSCK